MIDLSDWAQTIADTSELAEYQNCTIVLRDPTLVASSYSLTTNAYTQTGDAVVYTGRARFIGLRAAVSNAGEPDLNPTSVKSGRFQIPHASYPGLIKRGWEIRVSDGGRNTALTGRLFMVSSDVQGSNMASRTIEVSINTDAAGGWS